MLADDRLGQDWEPAQVAVTGELIRLEPHLPRDTGIVRHVGEGVRQQRPQTRHRRAFLLIRVQQVEPVQLRTAGRRAVQAVRDPGAGVQQSAVQRPESTHEWTGLRALRRALSEISFS
jgi:hypothetical protein